MTKIKTVAVSYLNTKPLLYGLVQGELKDQIDLRLEIPSVCAKQLESGEVDLGLVPVAVIPSLKTPYIISDYCIGAVGEVRTVCIYAEKPIEELDRIYLDYHSRTSVQLAQILIKEYWDLKPQFVKAYPGFEENVQGSTGAVIIGDRALDFEKKFEYRYDLAEVWMKHTGLPFVFAAWVSNKPLPADFIKQFNIELKNGIDHIPELSLLMVPPFPEFSVEEYFTKYISYELDSEKRKALSLFLKKLKVPLQETLADSLGSF